MWICQQLHLFYTLFDELGKLLELVKQLIHDPLCILLLTLCELLHLHGGLGGGHCADTLPCLWFIYFNTVGKINSITCLEILYLTRLYFIVD